jgi:hypothetical protein
MTGRIRSPGSLKPLAWFLAIALASIVSWSALTAYEFFALGFYPVREEPPVFTTYFLLRSLFALAIAGTLVSVLTFGAADNALCREPLTITQRTLALAAMFTGFVLTAVFLADPETFRAMAEEDSAAEWLSAILTLGAGCLFAVEALIRARNLEGGRLRHVPVLIASGFALLFFLIGMEEISWMQRIADFDTPAAIEEINWQGEFNLHNIHTDLSETVYYTGAGIFLCLFPLLREAVGPSVPSFDAILTFLPARSVAAISAPTAMFNYGHWNLIPIQVTAFTALFVMLAFGNAARLRGDRGEACLFGFLAFGILAGQTIFLTLGQRMIEIPNATEFKELFISMGIGWFAIDRFMMWHKMGAFSTLR